MDTLSIILLCFLALTIVFFGIAVSRSKRPETSGRSADSAAMENLTNRITELDGAIAAKDAEIERKNNSIVTLTAENAALRTSAENAASTLEKERSDHDRRLSELREQQKRELDEARQNYDTLLAQVREASEKQIEQLRQSNREQVEQINRNNASQLSELKEMNRKQVEGQMNLIKEQMRTTSEEILKQRRDELCEQNAEQVSKIINPLMDSFRNMKDAFEKTKESQNEAMARLGETIRINTEKNNSIGETADRLARALTGEVKAQGNFGELKLQQMLENMQLQKGEQYDTQQTLRDRFGSRLTGEDGKGLVPDIILHLPGNRYVVIDSKMSLTDFERYQNAEDGSPEKQAALKAHIASVRGNVALLSKKSYQRFLPSGYNHLDFAFMYVPIDAALNLALLNDATLWKEAYDKGVIILGPQTMYMNLRVLEMMWTQVRQLENQQTMIECANHIIERVQDFAYRFNDVEASMNATVVKINSFKKTIAPGGTSIITAARNLVKSGGKENHRKKMTLDQASNVFVAESPQIDIINEAVPPLPPAVEQSEVNGEG